MRPKLFWVAGAVFVAIAVHAGVILAAPGLYYGRYFDRLAAAAGPNSFFVLSGEDQETLFPAYPAASVTGACVFDVSNSDVEFSARMPQGFWTLTVYSSHGDVIYSVNDRQAGTNAFTLTLSRAPGLLETLRNVAEVETIEEDSGWTVKSVDTRGIAVLWFPAAEAAARPPIRKQIEASSCAAKT